ncbi:MAG TPA: DUF4864 domain-containing protein [Capsulimonadaceae bacterium]|jgi:hypothetical protein
MKTRTAVAALVVLVVLFAALQTVRSLTGDGTGSAEKRSKLSSLFHTMPEFNRQPPPAPAPLKAATEAQKKAAQKSITAQLDAFRQDDYYKARFYQGAGLQGHFRDADSFRTMMIHSYPQFAHYKSVKYGSARTDSDGEHVMIEADVTGKDGIVQHAIYSMHLENGVYRVESVMGGSAPVIGGPGREQRG